MPDRVNIKIKVIDVKAECELRCLGGSPIMVQKTIVCAIQNGEGKKHIKTLA